MVGDASLAFFSGGNPFALAETLRGSRWWSQVVQRLDDGMAFAGCSAGVSFLNEITVDTAAMSLGNDPWRPGLGYLTDIRFGLHWDMVDTWFPGATSFIEGSLRPDEVLVGIDEATAMVGDGTEWWVAGRAGVHVLRDDSWSHHASGGTFTLALSVASG